MNIPVEVVVAFLSVGIALQVWTLREVVTLKVKVAVLTQRVFHNRRGDEDDEP